MKTTVITSKGTTTIPKEIRDSLGLTPGSKVKYTMQRGRVSIERALTIDEVRAQNAKLMPKELLSEPTEAIIEKARERRGAELKKKLGL